MAERIPFENVHQTVQQHLQAEGYPFVYDYEHSHGSWLKDGISGKEYLDMTSFFATNPLGHNHPRLTDGEAAEALASVARINPANWMFYTREVAEFTDTFWNTTIPEAYRHLFLIAGGALAVENALKAAMDWKVQRNFTAGRTKEVGHQVMHFKQAFHGRSGYTLSLTNTAEEKIRHYPKFDWPRVHNPVILDFANPDEERVLASERWAVEEIETEFARRGSDICAIIIEPIQCEGGDNHFRPQFMRTLRDLADKHDAMLIFDEIQTGMGVTGQWWAFEHFDMMPDMVVFGKKAQVCGFFCGPRIDEVEKNVFRTPSRIASTWGGNLVDMVRATWYIRIFQEENLLNNATDMGDYLLKGLGELSKEYPDLVANPRGRGLLVSFTLPDKLTRDKMRKFLFDREVLALANGPSSIRFRPAMNVTKDELDTLLERTRNALKAM